MEEIRLRLTRIFALIRKEFTVMITDKGTRKVLILPIIIQSLLFGYGATFNLEHVPYVMLNLSNSAEADHIMRRIDSTPAFESVTVCHDLQCFNETVSEGRALLGIAAGTDFDRTKELFAVTDARNTTSANTALSYIQNIISAYNTEKASEMRTIQPYSVEFRYLYNEQNISRFSMMTGMILALSMIQVLMLASFSVSREREEGTFDMMLMTPLTPTEILIGKAIPPTLVATLQAGMLFLICVLWFEIPFRGSFISLLTLIAVFSMCNVGTGLAVSALVSTSQQSIVISFTMILPSILLSGMITPYQAMPKAAQIAALADPFYYGLSAMHRIYLEGQTITDVAHLLLPLIVLGAAAMTFAVYLFRGKLS